jgi:hypothetical protein
MSCIVCHTSWYEQCSMTIVLSSWLMHHVTCQPTLSPGQIKLGLLPCHAATQCWQLEQHDQSQHNMKSIVARACRIPATACSTSSAQHSRILSFTGFCARSPYQHSLLSRAAQEMGNTWPAGCTIHDCTDVKTAAKQPSTAGSCTLSPRTLVTEQRLSWAHTVPGQLADWHWNHDDSV